MKMRIREFAAFAGVSVRTLHYYHEIGLLKPAFVDRETGYRYYNEQSVLRMQEILFFRELDFPLKDIAQIVSSADYDKNKALEDQKKLLILKKERLERLICAIDGAVKGENIMTAFDKNELENYRTEARERWGETTAYREYTQRGKDGREDDLMAVFARFGKLRQTDPAGAQAQTLVKELQAFITDNYYTCTKQILKGLGRMYGADARFRENIDRAGGEGTAAFASKAIEIFCG